MVVGIPEHNLQADVVFVVEGTAVNGAYINDLRTNYIIPSLEYFNAGKIDDSNYISDNTNCIYGIVVYHAADCLPHLSSDTYGPFSSPSKLLNAIEKLDLVGGKGESHANIGEGLATALQCFEELQQRHDVNSTVQKHCILLCNSPPYSMPILESQIYSGKTAEQLASLFKEKNINLSIISPRKIPSLYKLFEKAGGDLSPSQTKNYAKDPRHLVLLKGYSLQERPISPTPGNIQPQQQNPITNSNLPITSMPSPLSLSSENPIPGNAQQNPNMMGNNPPPGMPNQYVRPQNPQGIVLGGRMIGNNAMAMGNQMGAPPGYMLPPGQNDRPWTMPPPPCQQPPRPYAHPNIPPKCGTSALLAQLNQPPSTIPGNPVNQFGQLNQVNPSQQIKINNPQQNIQTSIAQQNQAGIQTSINQVSQPNQVVTSQAQQSAPQQSPILGQPARERQTIWQGMLEWVDKHSKGPNDQPKTSKSVPCHVSANAKDGEPELRADGWPQKLMMQLMPKHLIGNIGGAYLKNSKSVLFHPQQCEALESLTRVMMSGFAGCVHFSAAVNPNCDLRVLILLYTSDKRAYLGFIPNDQQAFVDRLRRVIQQQKRMSQTGAPGAGVIPMTGAPPQIPGGNTTTAQSPQQQGQGMMISQTNTMTMGGGQITQNVSTAGPIVGQSGMIGQNVQCATRPPNIRMPNMQQGNNQSNIQQGMMGAPVQRAPFENQLQAERQQNLEKINQLKQTLEAAQQQEQQYKSQLERISHMKTAQLQEALQVAQQTEMHYKMLEQRMANPANTQVPNQPRMMRPTMPNNPGLRHLLQQQPQYRPQMMGMQQMGGNAPRPQMQQQMPNQGNNQPNSFDDVSNFDFNNIM